MALIEECCCDPSSRCSASSSHTVRADVVRGRDAATAATSRICATRSSSSRSPIFFKGVEFKVFAGPASDPKSRIAALRLPKGGELTREDRRLHRARRPPRGEGPRVHQGEREGEGARRTAVADPVPAGRGDAGVLSRTNRRRRPRVLRRGQGARRERVAERAAARARPRPQACNGEWKPLWVVDFPMFKETPGGG
jgi:aspartyl-tRNA synthetase